MSLRRRQGPPLTIISAYQVNKQPTNEVGITAWHQQRLLLDKAGRVDIHPRKAFIDDLTAFIKARQSEGHAIIIGGDLNETTDNATSGLLRLLSATELIDPWRRRFPNAPDFNTHTRGSTRIDHVFCSPCLFQYIESHAYAPFYWLTNSDHHAVVIDLNTEGLFSNHRCQQDQTLHSSRILRSNDTKQVINFIDKFHDHLRQNNAFSRAKRATTAEEIESLDKLITQASTSAEKQCKRRRPEFFSVTLTKLRLKKSLALAHLQALRQGINIRESGLRQRMQRYRIDINLTPNKMKSRGANSNKSTSGIKNRGTTHQL
jgi:hypothetical protein